MTGEYTMNTDRLHRFLGEAARQNVIRFTIADAFADSFTTAGPVAPGALAPN